MVNFFNKFGKTQNIIFLLGIIIGVVLLFTMTDIVLMFFASYVIASSLCPLVDKLEGKCQRSTASGVVLGGFILGIILLFLPILIIGGNEIKDFSQQFPQYIESIKHFAENSSFIKSIDLSKFDFSTVVSQGAGVTSNIFDFLKHFSSALIYLLVSIIFVYFLLVDRDIIEETYLRFFPKRARGKMKNILDITTQKVGGYVTGQFVAMASVGIIMTIGLLFLKVNYAILLGLITAIFDIVPIVGPAIALIICLVVAYKSGPIVLVLISLVFAFAQFAENNFVKPYVFGKLLNLHPMIIYVFLFVCAKYLGIVGVIFAPAIASATCVCIEELYLKNMEE